MISPKNGLAKFERSYSRKLMDEVFAEGKSLRQGPLKLIYLEKATNKEVPSSFVFTVSKRQFKRAHDRNYIKRLLREVFRVNKHRLNTHLIEEQKSLLGCFLFVGVQRPNYRAMEKSMLRIINQLIPAENELDESTA